MVKRILKRIFLSGRKNDFPYRYYLEKNKCIFIHVPKSAGTSILSALGKKEVFGRDHLPWYVYQKANNQKFQSYYKFSFVRNPWDRAYSAYSYLREGGNKRDDICLQSIIEKFKNFDDFVINGLQNGLLRNHPLFIPQSEFVVRANQELAVDFLGRYENIDNDFKIVADRLKIGEKLNRVNVSRSCGNKYFSEESVRVIKFIYAQDIDNFGYKFNR